jgi:hypothetical protein
MSYRLSAQVIGSKELAEAFRRAPRVTAESLSQAIGKTAFRTEFLAKKYAPIDKGNLRGSINTQGPTVANNNVTATVGTNVTYARYQEEGTGVYGPSRQPIRPKNAKVLAWKSGGQWHYARQVKGVKPKRYFRQAREEVPPYFTEQMRWALTLIVSELAK